MGNRDWGNTVQFKQSLNDFPLTVKLGEKIPYWGLSRWCGNGGLRFHPHDDEGFTLRGDKRRLVYKGRRRSHRFTILGDSSFEYDCILNREPESNVISLVMDGAENFDFFRQPDFVPDPFLKGSYAVYKKDTFVGEGTGKLCHIHRPEIIDARGRRCWGNLSIAGNRLCIAIPETWLSEAAYPVIVDPTIGTTTIGSQTTGPDPNNPGYDRPWLDSEFGLNKYQVPQNGAGVCTAYVYCYNPDSWYYSYPLLFTNVNNKPYMKKSQNENLIDVEVYPPSRPVGWRNNTFTLNGNISAGEYVWFGLWATEFATRFDYGGECYKGWFDYDGFEEYEDEGEPPPYLNMTPYVTYCTIKWSWYFNYTAVTSQNYIRTLTQGVSLTDSREHTGDYKRSTLETVNTPSVLHSCVSFFRQCVMNVYNSMSLERFPMIIRSIFEHQGISDGLLSNRDLLRQCGETVNAESEAKRKSDLFRGIIDTLANTDSAAYSFVFIRSINDTPTITDTIQSWRGYFRGLYNMAASTDVVFRRSVFKRTQEDTIQANGSLFRSLHIFLRIITTTLLHDLILGRFLRAKEKLVLKSCVTCEITLESRID
jgi:hypothetical protein